MTTPDRSPVAALRPVQPPIKCTSWRIHQDGHPDQRHAEDQRCETDEHRTYLHLRMPESVEHGYNYVTPYATGARTCRASLSGKGTIRGRSLPPPRR